MSLALIGSGLWDYGFKVHPDIGNYNYHRNLPGVNSLSNALNACLQPLTAK